MNGVLPFQYGPKVLKEGNAVNPRPSWDIPLSISTSGSKRTVCVGTSATRDEPAMDYFRLESRNYNSMDVLQVFSNARKMFSFPFPEVVNSFSPVSVP